MQLWYEAGKKRNMRKSLPHVSAVWHPISLIILPKEYKYVFKSLRFTWLITHPLFPLFHNNGSLHSPVSLYWRQNQVRHSSFKTYSFDVSADIQFKGEITFHCQQNWWKCRRLQIRRAAEDNSTNQAPEECAWTKRVASDQLSQPQQLNLPG
jgi:hypothetical protein